MYKQLNTMKYNGSWYADNARELGADIDAVLERSSGPVGRLCGAVLPHAGHMFSSRGIAPFFATDTGDVERIVILAPSHREYLPPDMLHYSTFTGHETPLGIVPGTVLDDIPDAARCSEHNTAVENEHAVEMFLPFIRHVCGDSVAVQALIIPQLSSETAVMEIADLICDNTDEKTAFIASSDFTHYGARFGYTPFGSDNMREVMRKTEQLDRQYAAGLCAGDIAGTIAAAGRDRPTICGLFPALVLSGIMNRCDCGGEICDYYTSVDVAGPSSDFVSYATVLFSPKTGG